MFLVNTNNAISAIGEIIKNEQGLYSQGNTTFCETDLILYSDIEVPSDINVGDIYSDGKFIKKSPIINEISAQIEPTTSEELMLAIAELDAQREQDKLETQLAIAELAETTMLGGNNNG